MSTEEDENIIDLYLKLTKQYKTQYGEQSVVLLMVGSFYEIYSYMLDGDISAITPIQEICQICNLNIADKKNIYDGNKKVVMAGFRDYSLDKYLPKITDAGYTAVVYNQEKNGKKITRKLHAIYSPGTIVSYDTDCSPQITNNIMCIWFELCKPTSPNVLKPRLIYGVSIINIFTGESFIFEHECAFFMNPTTFDELERCISVFSPSEVLFISPFSESDIQKIVQYSGIKTMIHYASSNDAVSEKIQNCMKQKYISHILKTFFNDYQKIHEFNEYVIATQSFCYLLNFIQEHNPSLVRNIRLPKFNNSSDRVVLANHTLIQLNIINDTMGKQYGQLSSVLAFLNRAMTPMGKRLFQYQLTNPTFDEVWLQTEYDAISKTLKNSDFENWLAELRKQLHGIKDLEKNCRQIVMRKINPLSMYWLFASIEIIQALFEKIRGDADIATYLSQTHNIDAICAKISAFMRKHLVIENCTNNTMENIICSGISKELDECISKKNENQEAFQKIRDYLSNLLKQELGANSDIKIHETEKSGKSLQITQKRAVSLKASLAKAAPPTHTLGGFTLKLDEIRFSKTTASCEEIHSPLIKEINTNILMYEEKINRITAEVYESFLAKFEAELLTDLENLGRFVAKLDVLQAKSYVANKYNYCCPILENQSDSSHISFKEIRHPLIEHINQNELYVTNDMELCGSGVLLFGTNAVGKTSLIRAIGIATIMAQAGLYVPCSSFSYKPYRAIFSRILSNDNLFKGLSTFAVEMSELRVILKTADQNSLILGDELASGTETDSALSIFAAALTELDQKQCSYMFATHFHEIADFDEIKAMRRLSMKHLAVKYDRELDRLIYDRKLKEGQGERIYGLEVCLSLDLPKSTMDLAFEFRNKYFSKTGGGILAQKTSRYNSKKIRGLCEICKTEMGTEVHHLLPQCDANDKGFIGHVHKNNLANLASVCEKCHREVHS